jgi:hypothetical protein
MFKISKEKVVTLIQSSATTLEKFRQKLYPSKIEFEFSRMIYFKRSSLTT